MAIDSPIQLSPEQKQAYLKAKEEEFRSGLKDLEEKTGMTIMAYLEPTPQAITAKAMIVPLGPVNKTTEVDKSE